MSRPAAASTPESSVQQQLARIWQDLFGLSEDELHPDSDFFEMGGTSLTAIKFLARVEDLFGAESLLPDTLFATPQIGALAAAIDQVLAERRGLR